MSDTCTQEKSQEGLTDHNAGLLVRYKKKAELRHFLFPLTRETLATFTGDFIYLNGALRKSPYVTPHDLSSYITVAEKLSLLE